MPVAESVSIWTLRKIIELATSDKPFKKWSSLGEDLWLCFGDGMGRFVIAASSVNARLSTPKLLTGLLRD
jgi:hypothetical protein